MNISANLPPCPRCGLNDKTYKVSLIYLETSARLHHHETTNQPELEALLTDLDPVATPGKTTNQLLNQMVQSFSPPSGEKTITRRIHPDAMIAFLGVIGLVMIFQIVSTQPSQLPIFIILFAASLLAYSLFRRTILQRYQNSIRQEKEENEKVEKAISRWMRLYYCSRDQGFFDTQQNRFVPFEEMNAYLKE